MAYSVNLARRGKLTIEVRRRHGGAVLTESKLFQCLTDERVHILQAFECGRVQLEGIYQLRQDRQRSVSPCGCQLVDVRLMIEPFSGGTGAA
jgi:hypothetical protein